LEAKESINKNIPKEEQKSASGGTEETHRERLTREMRERERREPRVFRKRRLR
jgi:hypothetical protein